MKQKGVSLFELLVMTAVLMVFIVVSSFAVGNKVARARDARRKSDLDRIKIALYDYHFDVDCFPLELPDCGLSFLCDLLGNEYVYVREETNCPSWFRLFINLENVDDGSIDSVGCRWGCGPECEFNYGVSSTNTKLNDGCVTYYACTPNGNCEEFYDPKSSGCPRVFENDESCGGVDCKDKNNRCHDLRGKVHEWGE